MTTIDNTYRKNWTPIDFPSVSASYIVQVHGIGDQNWTQNGIRYQCRECAEIAGSDLFGRWFGIDDMRVIPSDDQHNKPCTH